MKTTKLARLIAQLNDPAAAGRARANCAKGKLVDLLLDFGFAACNEDISTARGYWSHDHQDVTHRWTATVSKDGKAVEITGTSSIAECLKRGISIEPNEKNSGYYGDYVACAKPAKR